MDGGDVEVLDLLDGLAVAGGLGDGLEVFEAVVFGGVLALVTTSLNNSGVVGDTTTVPGKNLLQSAKILEKQNTVYLRWQCLKERQSGRRQWRWTEG